MNNHDFQWSQSSITCILAYRRWKFTSMCKSMAQGCQRTEELTIQSERCIFEEFWVWSREKKFKQKKCLKESECFWCRWLYQEARIKRYIYLYFNYHGIMYHHGCSWIMYTKNHPILCRSCQWTLPISGMQKHHPAQWQSLLPERTRKAAADYKGALPSTHAY